MREAHIRYLRCPGCCGELALAERQGDAEERIERGRLWCQGCRASYPITGYIPRFVADEGYAEGFGLEWNVHRRTQSDRTSGVGLSERRFFEETEWPRRLAGEMVIGTGAMVLSLDYSRAVEANYASNGDSENLLLVQGDLFRMPFAPGLADRLFCFGVLQHTPDPQAALQSLVHQVRPGGEIVADIYAKTVAKYALGTKYWVRPVTRRIAPDRLYRLTSRYVDAVWPLARRIRRVPRIGRALNWRLLIGDYSGLIEDDETLRDWARLDTFDMLAPRYDNPARASTAARWCLDLGLAGVDVHPGYNGIEIHARRPDPAATLTAV
jgi:uncharacterized protein YbaR (Trm112 family)/SAM-dependent methyltransferase